MTYVDVLAQQARRQALMQPNAGDEIIAGLNAGVEQGFKNAADRDLLQQKFKMEQQLAQEADLRKAALAEKEYAKDLEKESINKGDIQLQGPVQDRVLNLGGLFNKQDTADLQQQLGGPGVTVVQPNQYISKTAPGANGQGMLYNRVTPAEKAKNIAASAMVIKPYQQATLDLKTKKQILDSVNDVQKSQNITGLIQQSQRAEKAIGLIESALVSDPKKRTLVNPQTKNEIESTIAALTTGALNNPTVSAADKIEFQSVANDLTNLQQKVFNKQIDINNPELLNQYKHMLVRLYKAGADSALGYYNDQINAAEGSYADYPEAAPIFQRGREQYEKRSARADQYMRDIEMGANKKRIQELEAKKAAAGAK